MGGEIGSECTGLPGEDATVNLRGAKMSHAGLLSRKNGDMVEPKPTVVSPAEFWAYHSGGD